MGAKLKIIFFFISSINIFFAQTVTRNDEIKFIKQVALMKSLSINYSKIDTNFKFYKDVSISTYIQEKITLINSEGLDSLFIFVECTTGAYYKLSRFSHTASEYRDRNNIFQLCMEFYHSKELDRYIKKLIR